MSEILHIWSYIKDFAIFNVKQNRVTLPSELIHYIYAYVVNDELLNKINDNYIVYSLNKQLDNNRRWRAGLEDTRKFVELEGFFKKTKRLFYPKKSHPLDIREEITIRMKNIPYPSLTNCEKLYWKITELVEHKKYTHIKCSKNGIFWGDSYIDMQLENKSETIDCLFLKIYTNKEKVKKRELFFII